MFVTMPHKVTEVLFHRERLLLSCLWRRRVASSLMLRCVCRGDMWEPFNTEWSSFFILTAVVAGWAIVAQVCFVFDHPPPPVMTGIVAGNGLRLVGSTPPIRYLPCLSGHGPALGSISNYVILIMFKIFFKLLVNTINNINIITQRRILYFL